jgi:hypothetical protein
MRVQAPVFKHGIKLKMYFEIRSTRNTASLHQAPQFIDGVPLHPYTLTPLHPYTLTPLIFDEFLQECQNDPVLAIQLKQMISQKLL